MRFPGQSPRPRHSPQFQSNGITPSAPPQMMGNPGSFMSNPMQIQPQMAFPNNNSNTQFPPLQPFPFQMNQMNNAANPQQKGQFLGQNVVNPPQFLNNQNGGFGGLPNPMQNMNQLQQLQQMATMASLAQVAGGVPMFPNQMSPGMGFAMNQQLQAQLQMAIAAQQFQGQSQLMAMSNQMAVAAQQLQGQPPQMDLSQQWRGQLPQMNSFGGVVQQPQAQNFNAPISAISQVSQGMTPQNNSNFAMSAHLGLVNANGTVQPSMNGLSNQMPNATQQLQGQLPQKNSFGFGQQPQAQNSNAPASANTQANPGFVAGFNHSKGNWKNPHSSNFSRNQKHGAKSMKSQFGKRKLPNLDTMQEKGHHGNSGAKTVLDNSVKMEKKRPLLVTYSEREIQRWREERRKNYPSKANVEKKLTPEINESEDSSCAKLRRQQLKEILAKQAELGCEVAEIPSSYLSDSEKQMDGRAQKWPGSRKERFQNKFNKRERFKHKDRFSKKQRFGNSDLSNTCDQKGFHAGKVEKAREATLLKKLLSCDIRRDKRHLLQVFRFMTMNSYFKDWPEEPMRFPKVLLKETGDEVEAAQEKCDAIDATNSSNDSENDNENNIAGFTDAVSNLQETGSAESEE